MQGETEDVSILSKREVVARTLEEYGMITIGSKKGKSYRIVPNLKNIRKRRKDISTVLMRLTLNILLNKRKSLYLQA